MPTTPSLGPGQKPVTYCGYLPTESGLSPQSWSLPLQDTPGSPGNHPGLNSRQNLFTASVPLAKGKKKKELSSRVGSSAFQLCGLRKASNLGRVSLICKVVMSVDAGHSYTGQWAVGLYEEGCDRRGLPTVKPHTNIKWFYHADNPHFNFWSVSLRPMSYVFLDKEAT